MKSTMQGQAGRGRLILALILLFAIALLVGGLLAPPVFNSLVRLGQGSSKFEALRDLEFEKVANRCVLLSLLAILYPMLRVSGIRSWKEIGFASSRTWKKSIWRGWLVGTLSLLLLLLTGWAVGAYQWTEEGISGEVLSKMAAYLIGAVVVAFLEEPLFRGVVFGVLRRSVGVIAAALIAGFLFSAVHFASPDAPVGVVHAKWYSGLAMLPHLFTVLDLRWEWYGFMFWTLAAMGISLCFFYARLGSLYFIIGLHAGWVWVMRTGGYVFTRRPEVAPLLFGPSMTVSKGGAALILAALFALFAFVYYLIPSKDQDGS